MRVYGIKLEDLKFNDLSIPMNIAFSEQLNPTDKFIWALINTFDDTGGGVVKSDTWFARNANVSELTVKKSLERLENVGVIYRIEELGQRFLSVNSNFSEKTSNSGRNILGAYKATRQFNKKLSKLHHLPGCYFLYDKEDLIYIGKSINLGGRIRQSIIERNAEYFSYWVVRDKSEIDNLEGCLIAYHRPKLNKTLEFGNKEEITAQISKIDLVEESEIFKCFEDAR